MKKILFTLLGIIVLATLNSCYKTKSLDNADVPLKVSNKVKDINDSSFVKYFIIEYGDYVYFVSENDEIKHKYFNNQVNEGNYITIHIGYFVFLLILMLVIGVILENKQ